ncbi:MAG: DUF4906 domain-containing protein [Alistipes sp.]|nr:DUF4906 domain-containing protein [Alistipes sp.]
MKNLSKLILFVCFGILFAACNNDNLDTTDPNGNGGSDSGSNGPKVTKTFSFSIPEMASAGLDISRAELEEDADEAISFNATPVTRADSVAATAAEKTIKELYIMQFDPSGKRLNAFAVPSSDISVSGGVASADVTIDEVKDSKLYVFANCAPNGKGDTEAKLLADSVILPAAISAANIATTGLPMMGKVTLGESATSVKVPMSFLVSKIKTTVTNSLSGFTISKVDLYNVPKHIYITSAANTSVKGGFWTSYDAKTTATGELVFYVPENKRGTVTTITSSRNKSWWDAPDKAMSMRIYGSASGKNIYYEIFPGANSTTDFNVARSTVYTINPTIKGSNGADLRVWSAEDPSNLSSGGTANCYLVAVPGRLYYFDATKKGNGKNTTGITNGTTLLAPKGASIVWESNSSNYIIRRVKLVGNYVYFSTAGSVNKPVREGNALIAVRDAASGGNILWSWHIWSTAYNPTPSLQTYKVRVAGVASPKMMNRNLGAANNNPGDPNAFGLLYQWGRKDPFIGSAALSGNTFAASSKGQNWASVAASTTGSTAAKSVEWSIKHPDVFSTQINETTYDWVNAPAVADQLNWLWGNPSSVTGSITVTNINKNKGTKTIYDPCPAGYMVPPQYTWTNFTKDGNNHGETDKAQWNVSGTFDHGWKFYCAADGSGATTFYPAAGYRHESSGGLAGVGTWGLCHASSSYAAGSIGSAYLALYADRVSPLYGAYRASALSVRCVQEF